MRSGVTVSEGVAVVSVTGHAPQYDSSLCLLCFHCLPRGTISKKFLSRHPAHQPPQKPSQSSSRRVSRRGFDSMISVTPQKPRTSMAANAKNRVLDGDMRVISLDLSKESPSNEVTEITSVMNRPWGNVGTTDLDVRFNGGQLRAPGCGQDSEGA